MAGNAEGELIIIIPVLDDWSSLRLLLAALKEELQRSSINAHLFIVDDGSAQQEELGLELLRGFASVRILRLVRNMGHQRAVSIGIAFIAEEKTNWNVIVMDGDGEDKPSDVVRLYQEHLRSQSKSIIFARRKIRSESAAFCASYFVYRKLFRILTGHSIRFGNFSLIPAFFVPRVAALNESWSHYAGALVKSGLPLQTIDCDRGMRLAGKTGMNYVSLVVHGLAAIAVFSETVGTRALIAAAVAGILDIAAIITAVLIRTFTHLAIPGWATYIVGLSTILLAQLIMLSFTFIFFILQSRGNALLLPFNYRSFISNIEQLYPKPSTEEESASCAAAK
jgi:polyisoprenyl-phosphate glycosyltransferase